MIPLRDDNPNSSLPFITITLIVLCVLVFLWEVTLDAHAMKAAVYALGATPAMLSGDMRLSSEIQWIPTWMTVFTSMFLHGGWMHLIGNMLYLWIFGDNVEDAMGHGRFVAFYLLTGVAAVAVQALPHLNSTVPMIGASGAISGVLGAYLMLYPHARVLVLIPLGIFTRVIHLPALLVLGLWFGLQLLSSLAQQVNGGNGGGGVAFGAHVGGFIAGVVLIPFFKRRTVRLFAPARR